MRMGGIEVQLHAFVITALGSGRLHVPTALLQVKERCCPLDKSLGGSNSQSGRGGKLKNMLLLPRVEPQLLLGVPACRLVTTHSTIPIAVWITCTITKAEHSIKWAVPLSSNLRLECPRVWVRCQMWSVA